ncbi:YHS domain-containing protein [Maribacter aestuarii]|nr:YHS domain-containing protein [Maribacter aestuarii]
MQRAGLQKNPKHVLEYQGQKVFFCCDGCKVSFEKEPSKYIKT